jgi:putative molybdopterin biosynthesis protein
VAVAAAIAQGEADVGLGAESAAIAARLDFVPLIKERYDLIVLQETLVKGQMQKVLAVIQDKSFKKLLEPLSGYDLSETGNIINVDPKSN